MKINIVTQKELEASVGIELPRIWRKWSVKNIHSNPCADPTYPYNNVYIFRCPWFSIGLLVGLKK